MNDLNVRAARVQLDGLLVALAFAILIAIGLTAGAFTLSFSTLRDLAAQGLMPAQWAWIFPAIVDGAITGGTIAVIVLSKINGSDEGKKFFVKLLVAVVCISVAGNAGHAYKATQEAARKVAQGIDIGFTPLAPWASALIAIIPPLLVLAFSHGVGILIKAIGNAYNEYDALVNPGTAAETHDVATAIEREEDVASDVAPVAAVEVESTADPVGEAQEEWAIENPDTMIDTHDAVDVAHVADPAPVEVELREVIAPPSPPAAEPIADVEDTEPEEGPEQTVEALLAFIEQAPGLDEAVRETARLKIAEDLSFAAIAEKTDAKAPSTAMRRYRKAETAAMNAGFKIPPLPERDDRENVVDIDRHTRQNGTMTLLAQ